MKNLKLFLSALFICATAVSFTSEACTSAIISGRVTADGRPIMWKHRDTSTLDNCVRHFKGEKYDFIAVTGYAKNPKSVWMGTNEAGFSIMNTMSYNLNEEDGPGNRNGSLMTEALGICRTVDDFRNFLDTIPHPIPASTNYGVMDAEGHAGYFETGNAGYTFYDIDDPNVAPHGYIVRANFSVSGKFDEGGGYLRYIEADKDIFNATGTHSLTPQWFFSNMSRCYKNPLMGIDLRSGMLNKPNATGWTTEQDFIARRLSASAVVVHGVKPGENPANTVMWTSIGFPSVTPFIPLWVRGAGKKLPSAVFEITDKGPHSPLCDAASVLRDNVFSFKRGNNVDNYFNWELLFNNAGTGYMQIVEAAEEDMLKGIYRQVDSMRSPDGPDAKAINSLYDAVDDQLATLYLDNFNLPLR